MKITDYVVCPECKKELENIENNLKCNKCNYKFEIINDIPILLKKNNLNSFKLGESDFHDKIALEADDAHSLDSLRVKYLHADFLKPIKGMKSPKILDACCGSGLDILNLSKEGYEIFGVDISLEMVKLTSKRLKLNGMNSLVAVSDVENLPFDSEFFDIIYICGALHHTTPLKTLNEFKRCLKKDGLIIIGSEPNSWQYKFKGIKKSKIGKRIIQIFRDDYTVNENSPGDHKTHGFSKKYLTELFNEVEMEIFSIKPIWFLNGFLSLLKINPPQKIEELVIILDDFIAKVPLVNRYSWKWNITLKKRL
jgi:ubiquinone/menaquinone biosynthesis C-methylase UbiE